MHFFCIPFAISEEFVMADLGQKISAALPPLGLNPSTDKQGTTPGSFANAGRGGTAWTFSSPDTPGMPGVSEKTAWDFMPARERTDCVTQLEHARQGTITPEMGKVAM